MSFTRAEQKKVVELATRKGRTKQGRFLAEGVRLLEEADLWKALPMALYHRATLPSRAEQLLDLFRQAGVNTTLLNDSQIDKISTTENSQGLIGIFDIPSRDVNSDNIKQYRRILWCDGVADPGNLGTLLRSAFAFGFKAVFLSGDCADPYSPKVVRSSMGSIFAFPIYSGIRAEFLSLSRNKKLMLVAADSGGTEITARRDLPTKSDKVVLAVGSEASGLPEEIIDTAALVLRINHVEKVESLNVAVAGSILMRELYEH